MTDAADVFYFNHTPEGIAFMESRRESLAVEQQLMKDEVLSTAEGQQMVKDKLAEAEQEYALTVRTLTALKREAATCPDDQDWLYAWRIEQFEGSGEYRGWLKIKKAAVWRWRHLIQLEPGMVEVGGQGMPFNLEQIKEVPIDSLIPYGPSYRSEQRWTFRCVLHNEKTPSFVWYRDQNTFACFGCNQNGDVISLLMKMENLTFVEACKRLSE